MSSNRSDESPTLGERTVGTTGSIEVEPDSINIIPETARFTFDLRDPDDSVADEAVERAHHEIEAAAEREGVSYECEQRMHAESVTFPQRCVDAVQSAVDDLDYDGRKLVSGAGHDATYMASVCDTAMVFAVSEDGKSHTRRVHQLAGLLRRGEYISERGTQHRRRFEFQ